MTPLAAREHQWGANWRRWFLNSSQLDSGEAGEQASCDRVTGKLNRQLFEERLALAVARKRRAAQSLDGVAGLKLAVLLISLDACAALSDFGHPLLIEVARRLGKATRGSEPVVRVDDGQFVLLMEDVTSAADGERLAARLLDALEAPFESEGRDLSVSAFIGIAVYPDHGAVDTLPAHAGEAMRAARLADGKRHAVFEARTLAS